VTGHQHGYVNKVLAAWSPTRPQGVRVGLVSPQVNQPNEGTFQ
jgi:hypothetical protein